MKIHLALLLLITLAFLPKAWGGPQCTSAICETCFSPQEACDVKFVQYIDQAEKNLEVAIYNITLNSIGDALIRAKQRGVRVRIVADYRSAFAGSSIVERLLKEGLTIKLWRGESEEQLGIMHHKFTIIDGKILKTGSYNYSLNASTRNAENQMYVGDSATVNKFSAEFERLWTSNAIVDPVIPSTNPSAQ